MIGPWAVGMRRPVIDCVSRIGKPKGYEAYD